MVKREAEDFAAKAKKILDSTWGTISASAVKGPLGDTVDDADLRNAIQRSIRSRTKTYRYVLPTQVLAKLAKHSLDCRSLQVAHGKRGAFDARSLAQSVIVPFDAVNNGVLGGSPEPYVNNPLRVPSVSQTHSKPQKDKQGWSDLCLVLDTVETKRDQQFTEAVFRQVLIEIHRCLAEVSVSYPVPIRVSLEKTLSTIGQFLAEKSGGDREQAVAGALFGIIGERFGLYKTVRRAAINASDKASGLVADLECISDSSTVELAVEVKDREITVAQIESKLHNARSKKVSEILFVAQKGLDPEEKVSIPARIESEFASGQNVYILDLATLARVVLSLTGEAWRPRFLHEVGRQLEEYHSDIRHRRAWASLLSEL